VKLRQLHPGRASRRMHTTRLIFGTVLGICLLGWLSGCAASNHVSNSSRMGGIVTSVVAPSGWRYVWTDSLIAKREPFFPPPDKDQPDVKPDTLDGIPVWHGIVLVVPGTSDSVLRSNGFLKLSPQPGSAMHDYYEAYWPTRLDWDGLPKTIRQVIYGIPEFSVPYFPPEHEHHENGKTYCSLEIYVMPGVPKEFLKAYGILYVNDYGRRDGTEMFAGGWPKDLRGPLVPYEFRFLREIPQPKIE
jgi:hypothetical protein